jgi:hypothetical protein
VYKCQCDIVLSYGDKWTQKKPHFSGADSEKRVNAFFVSLEGVGWLGFLLTSHEWMVFG